MAEDRETLDGQKMEAECDSSLETPFKSGFVALVGRPNVGKSTLLNACLKTKLAITSPVAQTTRKRMRAVVNKPGMQLVFIDTPGLHKPQDALGKELNKTALAELGDADAICFLIDATKPVGRGDAWVAQHVDAAEAPHILVITKADLVGPDVVEAQLTAARTLAHFDDEIVLSAQQDFNVEGFMNLVSSYLPEGPQWFPSDMDTDVSDEDLVAEFVREKLFLHLRQELPHSVGVVCTYLEVSKKLARMHCTIMVERESQKGMVVGKRGAMIKRVGTEARKELEVLFGCKVFLDLQVQVQPAWRRDAHEIKRLGYTSED